MKHLFVRGGLVLGSRSNLVPEGIDRILKRGFISAADLLPAVASPSSGTRGVDWDAGVVARLREGGQISPERLASALAVQLRERLLGLTGWFDGRYSCQKGLTPPKGLPEPPPLPLPFFFSELEEFLFFGVPPEGLATSEPEPPSRGDLKAVGGASLFVSLALRKASGKLLFERGKRRKLFELENGAILSAASSDPGETLAAVLRRWRYLPDDVVTRLESAVRSRGTKFREVLLREDLLSKEEIEGAVRTLQAERVLEAFSWRSGTYEFHGTFPEEDWLPPPKEERTEKEHLLASDRYRESASALSKLFDSASDRALLVLQMSDGLSVEESFREIAAIWHREEGIRTLLIRMDPETGSGSNPSFWSAPEEYRDHLRGGVPEGVEILPLAPEERSPRNAEGILAYGRFVSYVNSKYDRVVWIVPPPTAGSPLYRVARKVVFVISPRDARQEVRDVIGRTAPAEPAGFLYHGTDRHEVAGTFWSRLKLSRFRSVLRP